MDDELIFQTGGHHPSANKKCFLSSTRQEQPRRRFWCWRFWLLSTLATLIISQATVGDGATDGVISGGGVGGATVSLNITQITSPLSMEALTGVSADQCKPWTVGDGATNGPALTWSYESRLLLVSISNVYEVIDITPMVNFNVDLQYVPNSLAFRNVDIADAEGLGFHLTVNATPLCGSTRLPTKILCNDGSVVPINKTQLTSIDAAGGGGGPVTQSLCGGRYFVSYRSTYSCSNSRFSSPSCKTSCQSTSNSTHCFTCDEHDGRRLCCPGSIEPECTIGATGATSFQSSSESQGWTSIEGTPLIIVVALSVLSALLLVACLLCTVLLSIERRKTRRADVAKARTANGWMKNGTSANLQHHQQSQHKNGTCVRVNGSAVAPAVSTPSLVKANGTRGPPSNASDPTPYAAVTHLPALASIRLSEQRRPASCDPTSAENNVRSHPLDANGYNSTNRNGRFAAPRARAPLEQIFAAHQKPTTKLNGSVDGAETTAIYARRRDLGTLF